MTSNAALTASVATQVVDICREVLEDRMVTLDSTTATVQKWDSLGHMNLIASLEARFGVELDIMEMAEADSVRAVVKVVEAALRTARTPLPGGS
jgi:acyl carrier protein